MHVRKSNRGAIRLYEEHHGYKVAGVAPGYYSDGEDAFLMQAELPLPAKSDSQVIYLTPLGLDRFLHINFNIKLEIH